MKVLNAWSLRGQIEKKSYQLVNLIIAALSSLIFLTIPIPVQAQSNVNENLVSTEGTEFWFSLVPNLDALVSQGTIFKSIVVTSKEPTSVQVIAYSSTVSTQAPIVEFKQTATLMPNQPKVFYFPDYLKLAVNGDWPLGKDTDAIHVVSDKPVTIIARNVAKFTTDGTIVLPVRSLGKRYFAATYTSSPDGSGYGANSKQTLKVIATTDETEVHVKVSDDIYVGSPYSGSAQTITSKKGDTLVILLNKGETYTIRTNGFYKDAKFDDADLTGTEISADKPIAVLSGSDCNFVPKTRGACDHLEEMLLPVDTYGSGFVIVPFSRYSYW